MGDDDYKRRMRESINFVLLLLATAGFAASHFHVGDYQGGFWIGILFDLMVAFDVTTRK